MFCGRDGENWKTYALICIFLWKIFQYNLLRIRILKIKIVKSGVDEFLLAVGTVSDFISLDYYLTFSFIQMVEDSVEIVTFGCYDADLFTPLKNVGALISTLQYCI